MTQNAGGRQSSTSTLADVEVVSSSDVRATPQPEKDEQPVVEVGRKSVTPEDPGSGDVEPELWFTDADAAQRSGFRASEQP